MYSKVLIWVDFILVIYHFLRKQDKERLESCDWTDLWLTFFRDLWPHDCITLWFMFFFFFSITDDWLIAIKQTWCVVSVDPIDHSRKWRIHVEEGEKCAENEAEQHIPVPVLVSGVLAALTKDWDRTMLFCLDFSRLSPSSTWMRQLREWSIEYVGYICCIDYSKLYFVIFCISEMYPSLQPVSRQPVISRNSQCEHTVNTLPYGIEHSRNYQHLIEK